MCFDKQKKNAAKIHKTHCTQLKKYDMRDDLCVGESAVYTICIELYLHAYRTVIF